MKYLFCLLIGFLFISCSDDNSNPLGLSEEEIIDILIGEWQEQTVTLAPNELCFNSSVVGGVGLGSTNYTLSGNQISVTNHNSTSIILTLTSDSMVLNYTFFTDFDPVEAIYLKTENSCFP